MGAEDTLFQRFGREFPKGHVLFREGEPGKEMFVLQSGRVAISKHVRDVEKVLATLGPGDLDRDVTYTNSAGQEFTSRVEDILLHVVMHGSYHRGQVAMLIRDGGGTPAPTDYIAFVRGAPAATRVS